MALKIVLKWAVLSIKNRGIILYIPLTRQSAALDAAHSLRMLEHLFGSQTRVKLLQIFLNNPEKKFFVRELTRLADSQINAIRRELSNLVNLELIGEIKPEKGSKAVKQKYYQANVDALLFSDLKSLIQKNQLILEQQFSKELEKMGDIRYMALTGRFVGLGHIPTDLFIVGQVDKVKFNKIVTKFQKEFGREINFTIMDLGEYTYRKNVADKFLYSIIENKKVVMVDTLNVENRFAKK